MKNPFTKSSSKILLVVFFISAVVSTAVYTAVVLNSKGKKKELARRMPGSLLSMDLWSSMRTYPAPAMDAHAFAGSHEQSGMMELPKMNALLGIFSPTTAPWTNLGPKNFAGRILSIGFHPTNANIMWVGSASGGLWKTTNGGNGAANGINWTYVPMTKVGGGTWPVLGISSIAVHPTQPNTIYVGTGEVYSSNAPATGTIGAGHIRTFRGSYGIGILKTTDGGATWENTYSFTNSNLKGVMDILIHPTNPDTVFAATTDGIYRTYNEGASWQHIHTVPLAMDLIFKPGNPNVLYAGVGNFGSTGSGLYKSTDANAASPTFTKLAGGLPAGTGKIMLSISAASTSKIYASIGRNPNVTGDPCGLYYSTNEGTSWTATPYIDAASKVTNQGWYAHDIAAHPVNHNTVIWAELDTWRSTNITNASPTITKVGLWDNWDVLNTTVGTLQEGLNDNYVHADVHRIQFSPHDATGQTVFLLSDGGVFRSTDGGLNYQTLNGGLVTAQIYSNMAMSKQDANFMVGGLQDNEGFIYSGTPGSKRIPNLGDGFHCAINTRDDDTCYITGYYFNLKRSVNRGTSFATVAGQALGNPPSETAAFNTPFVLAPSNPNIMYAGTYRIKKSTDRGATWGFLSSPLFDANCAILYIAVAPTNPNILYVSVAPGGTADPKILKSTDGGASFTNITGTLPDRYYSDIEVDPTDPNRVAVTTSGFGSSHLYMTLNGGTTWSDLDNGLMTDVPTNTVMFDPTNRRTVYIGNDIGVFYANNVPISGVLSSTTPLNWIAYNDGFEGANMVSDLLVTNTNKLRIASYGRGLWERDLAPASTLPVIFKNFEIDVTPQGNHLEWVIASQSNASKYEVEYSSDGLTFTKVGSVPAKDVPGDITYSYLHAIQNTNDGFYRIRNVDLDGSYTYSSVEIVRANRIVTKLNIYPNPTTGLFKIKLPVTTQQSIKVVVYDNAGKVVLLKHVQVQPGFDIPVDISKMSAGTYQLLCVGSKNTWTSSVVKK